MDGEFRIKWGKYMDGELLAAWPKDENGQPEEPAYLCMRYCTDLSDKLTVNMLQAYGIPCLCMARGEGSLGRVVLGISGYGVEIYVPRSLLNDAKVLIEEENHEEL